MLLNFLPLAESNNPIDRALCYAVFLRKLGASDLWIKGSNLPHVILGKFCNRPTANILGMDDHFKVIRVDARPISALVVNFKSFWDRSVHFRPVPDMGIVIRSILSDIAVPAFCFRSQPNPARCHVPTVFNGVRRAGHSSLMTVNPTDVGSANKASGFIRLLRDWGFLSAPAETQAGRIGDILGWHLAVLSLSDTPRLFHQCGDFRKYTRMAV